MTIEELIAECTAYDYKEALEEKKPKSWLKSVSAFSNTMGGSLFFGVDNDGNVKGLDGLVNGPVSSPKGSLKEVYMVVTNNPGIKIGQVAKVRKKSESTVKKQLTSLRKMGLIEYCGSDKTGGILCEVRWISGVRRGAA